MSTDKPESDNSPASASAPVPAVPKGPSWGLAGEIIKYSAVITIVVVCVNILRKRLRDISWSDLWEGVLNVPTQQLVLAIVVTGLNFVILTGYDWIAITYLKKKLPWRKIMVGAVIGYAFSNVLGWMIGGTAARFRLYTRWGFSLIEVITFISVLSVTFWLGMFMLAGVALVSLPVHLPEQYAEHMPLSPQVFGYVFLVCVLAYLAAALLVRKPIKIGQHNFSFPPFRLSLVQLSVSAADFALASLVLYLLLPNVDSITYGTVLVSYIVAMLVTVILHVPGGFGVLEIIVLEFLTKDVDGGASSELIVGVTCGIVLFRVIYYFAPGFVAGGLFVHEERTTIVEAIGRTWDLLTGKGESAAQRSPLILVLASSIGLGGIVFLLDYGFQYSLVVSAVIGAIIALPLAIALALIGSKAKSATLIQLSIGLAVALGAITYGIQRHNSVEVNPAPEQQTTEGT